VNTRLLRLKVDNLGSEIQALEDERKVLLNQLQENCPHAHVHRHSLRRFPEYAKVCGMCGAMRRQDADDYFDFGHRITDLDDHEEWRRLRVC